MYIGGYQPVSLLDYPGKVAAIVFTQGCPFRCVYCHNPELLPVNTPSTYSSDDIIHTLQEDRNLLDGVCITGGEPTIHPDLPEFLEKIKNLGLAVKLDTNGLNPHMIKQCIQHKLVDYFAMDIKHRWERYTDIIGTQAKGAVENCKQTLSLIQESEIAHEFRTTVYPDLHTQEDLIEMAGYLHKGEQYALQPIRFNKTLVNNLPHTLSMNFIQITETLKKQYPHLDIILR